MKVKSIPSSWISRHGLRLDCNPYMSGALEARIRLEELSYRKDDLASLCSNGMDGIYHAGRESRSWVDDPELGVPFLSSSSILAADLSGLPLISKKQVKKSPKFLLGAGWTLITRSGTIGRMVYSRPDMEGLACSEHVMRVVPENTRIPPGYLYAFLSSKFGVPLVTSGTYGSIIQSIEPEHIAGLPVPRLGNILEAKVNSLVELAAKNRSEAAKIITQAIDMVVSILGPAQKDVPGKISTSTVRAKSLQTRLDAFYYSPMCSEARRSFDMTVDCEQHALGDVADVFIPGIFKRRYAEDPSHGVPYITGGDVFQIAPSSERFLMKRVAAQNILCVTRGTILVQEAGQLGGLIGKSVFVGEHLDGFAVSNNMVRVTARDPQDGGFIYALLSTPQGVTLISREAAGSSIPHMDAARLKAVSIPWPPARVRKEISAIIEKAVGLRDKASVAEREARSLVEHAIEAPI